MTASVQKLEELSSQNKNAGVLLLVTNPRSGSTWLLDALRSHPTISMLPEASLFELLGLSGRRYPRDLSGEEFYGQEIEVEPDQNLFEHIPLYSLDSHFNIDPYYHQHPYLVEKLHPHFFNFDIEGFIDRANLIGSRFPVKIIYLVRDPRASLDSFFQYQQRNTSWNASRSPSQVIAHMKQIYTTIEKLANQLPGLILVYQDLVDDFYRTMVLIFQHLWLGSTHQDADSEEIIKEIRRITDREKRSQASKFFSEERGLVSGTKGAFNQIFKQHKDDLDECYSAYHKLLDMRAKVSPKL